MKIFYAYVTSSVPKHQDDFSPSYQHVIEKYMKSETKHDLDIYSYEVMVGWEESPKTEVNENSIDILERIQKADATIFEMTFPSQTLGFLLGYAILRGKPSLYLYEEGHGGKPAIPLFNNPSRLLSIKDYADDKELKSELQKFLRKAQKQLRSDRTTFVTTRYINDYLNWKTKKVGISKGEVIRGILEEAIDKDQTYEDK